jgi:nucleoside-diphosphate-sugar epimerase
MRYLVTGALGAIGAWTLRALIDHGHEPVILDLGTSDHRLRLALTPDELAAVPRVEGDVTDLAALERVADEYDIERVIHLAAMLVPLVRDDPMRGAEVNVTGTVNVLELARRRELGPVVYASSIAALAPDGGYPTTLYGVFKLANEGTARCYFEDFGVPSVGLRPHTVYGPGRDHGLTSAPTLAIAAAAAGERYRIGFGGSMKLQYVADAGVSFVRASESAADEASVHHLDGPVVSVNDVIAAIEQEAPEAKGLISASEPPLPFPPAPDASSFIELVGGRVSRPLQAGVAETMAQFRV